MPPPAVETVVANGVGSYPELAAALGKQVVVDGNRTGVLRFYGETSFDTGVWCGVELPAGLGKNDGSVNGVKYFDCQPKTGLFVKAHKVSVAHSAHSGTAHKSRPTPNRTQSQGIITPPKGRATPERAVSGGPTPVGSQRAQPKTLSSAYTSTPMASRAGPKTMPSTTVPAARGAAPLTRQTSRQAPSSSNRDRMPSTITSTSSKSAFQKLGSVLQRSLGPRKNRRKAVEASDDHHKESIAERPLPTSSAAVLRTPTRKELVLEATAFATAKPTKTLHSSEMQKQLAQAKTIVDKLGRGIQAADAQLEEERAAHQQALKTIETLKTERDEAMAELRAQSQAAIEKLKIQTDTEMAEVKAQTDTVMEELRRKHTEALTEVSRLEETKATLEGEMASKESEIQQLQEEKEELKKAVTRSNQSGNLDDGPIDPATLKADIESLRAVVDIKTAECRRLQSKADRFDETESTNMRLTSQVNVLSARLEQLQIALWEKKESEGRAWVQAKQALEQLTTMEENGRHLSEMNEMLRFRLQEYNGLPTDSRTATCTSGQGIMHS